MKSNYARSLKAVLAHEGGYVDHVSDPGGATSLGITFAVLKAWRGHDITKDDVKALTLDEASAIYKANYWDKVRGDDLPPGVDYAVFDFAVNSGVSRAAIFLQEIIGAAPDGKIGPATIKALSTWDSVKLIEKLCAKRMAFLERLSTFAVFGRGWSSRVSGVLRLAKDMALAFPSAPIPSTTPTSAPPKRKTLMDLLKGWLVKKATDQIATQLKDTPLMNSNLFHNILNIVIALVAILSLPEVTAILPPDIALATVGVVAALKTVINVVRDGFGGLFKEQPPVR